MKIKIIDLLNKIANGEESINVETKYDSDDWEIDDFLLSFYKEFEYKNNYEIVEFLNDYVEIIEEPKKIEKLELVRGSDLSDLTDKDMILRNNALVELCKTLNNINNKINELIDEINNLKRE